MGGKDTAMPSARATRASTEPASSLGHTAGVSIAKERKPRGAKGEAWGLLNPYGDLWTYETFSTRKDALAYVEAFWRSINADVDLSQFLPIRVTVRVSATAAQAIEARRAATTDAVHESAVHQDAPKGGQ